EVGPRDMLHRDEYRRIASARAQRPTQEVGLVGTDIVDLDDVRVGESGQQLSFAHQSRPAFGSIGLVAGVKELDGDLAVELWIMGAVDRAASARCDALCEYVTIDGDSPGLTPEQAGFEAREGPLRVEAGRWAGALDERSEQRRFCFQGRFVF